MLTFVTLRNVRGKKQNATVARYSTGFTLIELLVVTGIVVIVSAVILANNARFGATITLENLAYDMALTIRQAQVYGIAVRSYGAGNYQVGYGMHFDRSSPGSYLLFADAAANGIYDQPGDGLVQNTTLQGGFRIKDLCVRPSGLNASTCANYTCGIQKLDILFKRPEPDAFIRVNSSPTLNEAACIILVSPRSVDDTKSIVVEATGQISVQ